MRGLLLIVSSIVWAAPAAAQDAQQTLWGRVTFGMSKEAFKAAYPSGMVDLGNGCNAAVRPAYDAKRIYEVSLIGATDDPFTCASDIAVSLSTKYGDTRSVDVSVEDSSTNLVGGGVKRYMRLRQLEATDPKDVLDTVRTTTWFTGDTLVTLRLNETLKTWAVRYQQATVRKPAVTDKL